MISLYDKSTKEKVYTFWDDETRRQLGEVRNVKTGSGWEWRCGICRTTAQKAWAGCEHMAQAWRFLHERRREAEERAKKLDELYPAEPAQPRRKFAPVPA